MITIGLSEINVGDAASSGVMPTSMAKIGQTYKDTCKCNQEKAEVTEHFEEGKAAPTIRKKTKKVPVLTFSIMDPDPAMLAKYVGGTVVNGGWAFDGDEVVANRAITAVSQEGLNFEIPNADIEAVVNDDMSAKGIFLVDFTVTPCTVETGKAFRAVPKA